MAYRHLRINEKRKWRGENVLKNDKDKFTRIKEVASQKRYFI